MAPGEHTWTAPYRVEWLDVEASEWTARRTVDGGQRVRLESPGSGKRAPLVERQ